MIAKSGKQQRHWGLAIAAAVFAVLALAFYFDGVTYGGWRSELALYLYLLHIDPSGGVLEDAVIDYWIDRKINLMTSGALLMVGMLLAALRMALLRWKR